MMWIRRLPRIGRLITVGLGLVFCGIVAGQDQELPVMNLDDRLAVLTPEAPLDYFLLAEEVGYEATNEQEHALAMRLFLLAMHLDADDGGETALARSACIAMADLVADTALRRQLRALAALYDAQPRTERFPPRQGPLDRIPDELVDEIDDVLEGLSLYRLGEGRMALTRFRSARAEALLLPYQIAIGSLNDVRSWCKRNPVCHECSNRRVIESSSTDARPYAARLCPLCSGRPGPDLADHRVDDMLRLEAALHVRSFRTWSSQMAVDGGKPLSPVNRDAVAEILGVDPRATLWRDGVWVRPVESSPERPADRERTEDAFVDDQAAAPEPSPPAP
ncbi:MAG: hypothetical protein KAS72_14625 [Phycisphaerales bacterium]|nr:hypothetical protein [Phycisphaerales bacterium]